MFQALSNVGPAKLHLAESKGMIAHILSDSITDKDGNDTGQNFRPVNE